MRYWDTSALVPLLIEEASSAALRSEYRADPEVMAWWATEVECVSALCRLERGGEVTAAELAGGFERLRAMAPSWRIVEPIGPVRATAIRLMRMHPLTAADSLQLAAALEASERRPDTLGFITRDERLARAAEREGFRVLTPIEPEA